MLSFNQGRKTKEKLKLLLLNDIEFPSDIKSSRSLNIYYTQLIRYFSFFFLDFAIEMNNISIPSCKSLVHFMISKNFTVKFTV